MGLKIRVFNERYQNRNVGHNYVQVTKKMHRKGVRLSLAADRDACTVRNESTIVNSRSIYDDQYFYWFRAQKFYINCSENDYENPHLIKIIYFLDESTFFLKVIIN